MNSPGLNISVEWLLSRMDSEARLAEEQIVICGVMLQCERKASHLPLPLLICVVRSVSGGSRVPSGWQVSDHILMQPPAEAKELEK